MQVSPVQSIVKATSPFLDRGSIRARERIVALMAEDLRSGAASGGSVTEEQMELLGWTPQQLLNHGTEAKRLARKLSERAS